MTDNTEPTIDGEVRNIIGQIPNYVLGYLEISDGIKQEWADHQRAYLQIYSDRITKLISDQVAKAKIEELEHIISGSEYSDDDFSWYEKTRDEYTGTNYYSEVRHLSKADRIAELRSKQ